ncbi:MAG: hypothetical protein P4N41_09510 [Negativicutes bacterium]|nr:hypothetical protein [Negativicutes bacterium]
MAGEATHRTLRTSKDEGVSQAVSMIRDSLEDDEQRAKRREYQQYLSRMELLRGLSGFSYEQFDYTPYLERKEYVPPETPDFSYLAPEAEKRVREQYKPHLKAVGGVLALAVFVDFTVLDTPAGILSILSVLVAGLMVYRQVEDQRRAITAAVAAAEAEAARLLAEFHDAVEKARVEFDYDENERVVRIKKLLDGKPDTVLDACQGTAAVVEVPFVLRGGIELSGPNALISFKMPDDEFVPRTEWQEIQSGRYSVVDRSLTNLNQLYAEAVSAAMVQVILRIFEQVPTLENIAVNVFKQAGEKEFCLLGVAVSREDLATVAASQSGLKLIEERGSVRIQTSCSLSAVEPVMPEWLVGAAEREVHKGGIHCTVKVG